MALLLTLLLAACGGGAQPFSKSQGVPGPSGKPVPPVALLAMHGLPPDKVQVFKDALSASAGKRDIAIVEGALDTGTFGLTGDFTITAEASTVRLAYAWTLADKAGTILHTIAAEETAPVNGAADPWSAITPEVLQRVAAFTSESLSSRLSELGYATQVGGLPPPLESFKLAGPGTEKDIDYETFYGPGNGPVAATAPVAEPAQTAVAKPEPRQAEKSKKTPPGSDQKVITAVAVVPVKGSPGKGNAELTGAMRATLKSAGWPVLASPRDDALTIAGQVKLGPKQGPTQNVALAWQVSAPDGRVLGTIDQANAIVAGSLDQGWGRTATDAAQAAATGIFDLIRKFR